MTRREKQRNRMSSRGVRRTRWAATTVAATAVLAIGIGVFAWRSHQEEAPSHARLAAERTSDGRALPVVSVYKSPTCGCCSKWVDHLREHGFTVHTTDTTDVASVKARHGVPPQVESCHTALVDGYVLEGHVPAGDLERLLEERPAIAGLAVAGMPTGSPGMEVPGVEAQPYNVMAFGTDGSTRVFARHT